MKGLCGRHLGGMIIIDYFLEELFGNCGQRYRYDIAECGRLNTKIGCGRQAAQGT